MNRRSLITSLLSSAGAAAPSKNTITKNSTPCEASQFADLELSRGREGAITPSPNNASKRTPR
jgi:hypothetical protein